MNNDLRRNSIQQSIGGGNIRRTNYNSLLQDTKSNSLRYNQGNQIRFHGALRI